MKFRGVDIFYEKSVAIGQNSCILSVMAKTRGASFPYIDLQKAVSHVKKLYAEDGRHAMRRDVATDHLGYGSSSSNGHRCLAALLSFGLLERVAGGAVRVTDAAARIVLDENADDKSEYIRLIRECALRPKLYAALRECYGSLLPSDANIRSKLILDLGLNDGAVDRFLKNYRMTMSFASLDSSEDIASAESQGEDDEDHTRSDGQLGGETDSEGETQNGSGLTSSGTQSHPPRSTHPAGELPPASPARENQSDETYTLRFPLARATFGEVTFFGTVTQRSIRKLIAFLELGIDAYPEQ